MKLLLVLLVLPLAGCFTDPDNSTRTLDNLGFTKIEIGGYDAWSCGDDYTYHTKFTAINPNGKKVSGTVCCGFFKGCSVKF